MVESYASKKDNSTRKAVTFNKKRITIDGFAFWRNLERSNALTNKALDYRPEIDGLRALAVLPVILFHAGFEMFSGGFVGVDVFFVISGYLITTIILSDLEQGKFSIIDFYERRARRILPALFVVMLVSIPFAWFWFLPSDMKFYSRSLVAVSMFASNFLFWRETGYFDTSAEIKPLLHTWSLAVEEQYYVIFPLFLMLFWRFGTRRIFILLLIVFVASFVSAQLGASSRPAATFFLLPTRGWELLIGAFTAFYLYRSNRVEFSGWFREIGSWLGVALIFFSVFAYSEATPFPGIHALVPTVGTMLIILFATQSTTTGRFLGNKYFVGIGLISYSAYLWHQPLFAFARQRSLVEPDHQVFAILSVTSLILAYFSWRYIETPFRKKGYIRRSKIFAYAFCLTVFFIGVGLVGHITEGVFGRQNIANTMQLDARVAANHGLSADCAGGYNESSNCMTDKNPEVLVWGNSYAMHLVQGLIASNPKIKLVQKTISVCGPIFDIAPINAKYVRSFSEDCLNTNGRVFEYLKNQPSIKYVVMSAPFVAYVGRGATVLTKEGEIVSGRDVSYNAMLSTINRIKELGKVPVLFSPTPENGKNIGRCLVKASFFNADSSVCNVSLSESHSRQAEVFEYLKKLENVVTVVWLTEGLCSSGICRASVDDVFIYRDFGHLSFEGSAYLGKKLDFYGRLEKAAEEK